MSLVDWGSDPALGSFPAVLCQGRCSETQYTPSSRTGFLCYFFMAVFGVRWQSRRMCTHLLLWELQNYNSLLNNSRLETVGSNQIKIFHIQGPRRNPSKMAGGAKSCLESNPLPARHSKGSIKPCATQDPESPQRLSQIGSLLCIKDIYRYLRDLVTSHETILSHL